MKYKLSNYAVLTLRTVKGLIAQANAIGCDTSSGAWIIEKSVIFDDIIMTNGVITFSSRHNRKEFQDGLVKELSTSSAMPTVADDAAC